MSTENGIADYWATGDVYALIVEALRKAGKPLDGLTLADLAPVAASTKDGVVIARAS